MLSSDAHSSSQTSKTQQKTKKILEIEQVCNKFHRNIYKYMILPRCSTETETEREFSLVDALLNVRSNRLDAHQCKLSCLNCTRLFYRTAQKGINGPLKFLASQFIRRSMWSANRNLDPDTVLSLQKDSLILLCCTKQRVETKIRISPLSPPGVFYMWVSKPVALSVWIDPWTDFLWTTEMHLKSSWGPLWSLCLFNLFFVGDVIFDFFENNDFFNLVNDLCKL